MAVDAGSVGVTPARKPRLLYIAPDVVLDLPAALSPYFDGDYVATWLRSDAPDAAEDLARINAAFGAFEFHPRPRPIKGGIASKIEELVFYVKKGIQLSRERGRYDVVVCYSPFRTGVAGILIQWFTGTPAIIEFPSNPASVFSRSPGLAGRVRHHLSPWLARIVAHFSSGIMILYPWQVDALRISRRVPRHLVHAFVRMNDERVASRSDDYVLLMGKPWLPKGADVLVKAFLRITDKHPTVRLIIAGSDENPEWLKALVPSGARIDIVGRMSHDESLSLISGCRIFALPSWTEGTPRTIIEAYSRGRPVVATRTDGIPYLVRQDDTGELVSLGSDVELAAALDRMLSNPERAEEMGRNGQKLVRTEFAADYVARMWSEAVKTTLTADAR